MSFKVNKILLTETKEDTVEKIREELNLLKIDVYLSVIILVDFVLSW